MVQIIADRFGLSSLKFNTLETLIEAIGLPEMQSLYGIVSTEAVVSKEI